MECACIEISCGLDILIPMVFGSVKGLPGANDKFQRVPRFKTEGYGKEEALNTSFIVYACGRIGL